MQFAVDAKNDRIHISNAIENGKYFCPSCGFPVIQRHGQVNIEHFAHAKGYLCTDNWHYEEMSEWHKSFQSRFPSVCQEYVMTNGLDKHRADVFINNTVIEFQHSPMTVNEFQDRNRFYTGLGYRVIWLFDVREAFEKSLFPDENAPHLYRWKYAPKTLKGINLREKVHVYFQIKNQDSDEDRTILRLTGCIDGDLSAFSSNSEECYSEEEFIKMASFGRQAVDRNRNTDICQLLTHVLYAVYRNNGDREYFGCPMNKNGYAPMIREYSRQSCDECKYCVEYDETCVKCCGRYSSIMTSVDTILAINHFSDDSVISVEYIDKDGDICKYMPDVPEFPGDTLPNLSKKYDTGIMIVRNIMNGNRYKITKPVSEYLDKYHRVYGFYWNDYKTRWSEKSREIYYATSSEWIVEWFKTRKEVEMFRNNTYK